MTAPLEYVALADCHDASNVFSSQMAYFPNDTASKPQDVAIVSTTAGQTAIWACSTTSALFTTTNTEFVAQLGPKVSEGEYAGTGTNGYDSNNGGFRCWEQFSESKYTYGGVTCNMVYSCNHNAAPGECSPLPCADHAQLRANLGRLTVRQPTRRRGPVRPRRHHLRLVPVPA